MPIVTSHNPFQQAVKSASRKSELCLILLLHHLVQTSLVMRWIDCSESWQTHVYPRTRSFPVQEKITVRRSSTRRFHT